MIFWELNMKIVYRYISKMFEDLDMRHFDRTQFYKIIYDRDVISSVIM